VYRFCLFLETRQAPLHLALRLRDHKRGSYGGGGRPQCLRSEDTPPPSISPLEAGLGLGWVFGPLGAMFELLKHIDGPPELIRAASRAKCVNFSTATTKNLNEMPARRARAQRLASF
jgi:hypothetical protein